MMRGSSKPTTRFQHACLLGRIAMPSRSSRAGDDWRRCRCSSYLGRSRLVLSSSSLSTIRSSHSSSKSSSSSSSSSSSNSNSNHSRHCSHSKQSSHCNHSSIITISIISSSSSCSNFSLSSPRDRQQLLQAWHAQCRYRLSTCTRCNNLAQESRQAICNRPNQSFQDGRCTSRPRCCCRTSRASRRFCRARPARTAPGLED
mmetsp:Transcript_138913/g.443172  ORF Transcript_138913/g.443172 Transcript_138913/m.443172 type:complete len:201 (+) Transcript_138913:203-805(+)